MNLCNEFTTRRLCDIYRRRNSILGRPMSWLRTLSIDRSTRLNPGWPPAGVVKTRMITNAGCTGWKAWYIIGHVYKACGTRSGEKVDAYKMISKQAFSAGSPWYESMLNITSSGGNSWSRPYKFTRYFHRYRMFCSSPHVCATPNKEYSKINMTLVWNMVFTAERWWRMISVVQAWRWFQTLCEGVSWASISSRRQMEWFRGALMARVTSPFAVGLDLRKLAFVFPLSNHHESLSDLRNLHHFKHDDLSLNTF